MNTKDEITYKTFEDRAKKLDYPIKPKKPILHHDPTASEAIEYAKKMETYEIELKKHKELKDKFNQDSKRINDEFKQWAIDEVGLKDHPRADKAYSYAWEQGHSNGYSEVYNYLIDIAEVLIG